MSKIYKYKTLLGHNGIDFSISCLKTFINNAEQEIHLQIFEDGTITLEDEALLFAEIPNCTIVNKQLREKIVNRKLEGFPKCFDYRNNTNYAQKLFDIMLYQDEDALFIDSDIFFTKKFRLPDFGEEPVFMADTHNAYSIKPLEIFKIKYPIYPCINSGIFYFPYKLFDLNFIEELLNDKTIHLGLTRKISWLEQTIWAFLATKIKNVCYFDYDQIVMAQEVINKPIKDELIAVHCVFALRGYAFESVKMFVPGPDDVYHDIKLIYIDNHLNKLDYVVEKIKKKWRHLTVKSYIEKNRNKIIRPNTKRYR